MPTQIEFLQQYKEDLLEAAWRESLSALDPAPKRRRRFQWRWPLSRRWTISLGVALTLVAAGVIGYVVQHEGQPAKRYLSSNRSLLQQLQNLSKGGPSANGLVGSGGGGGGGTASSGRGVSHQGTSPTTSTTTGSTGFGVPAAVPGPVPSAAPSSAPGIGSTPEVSAKIVKKGEMSVQVQKGAIDSSIQQATDIAARYNGYVQSTSTFGADTGSVDLRVPVTKFEHAIAALARLGHVTSRQISGIDVTAHYVDLKGRLQIAEQQRTVLLKLLSHATSIEDTLRLQNALTPVQLNIEQLKGQIRLLATQAAQSTITVDFATPNAPAAVQRHAASAIHTPSFARGLKYAWAGFLDVVVAVLVGLGYLIPIGLVVFLVWLIVRRMRRPRTA